ncbi:MAG: 50S ribosomal protein L31 [Candidatus Tagabacteria bacterium RIFCSPLOWO2_01_FULL_39_11]|uniref:Large ribosomal subunit protein bL31 n=1 Tax=Candidatus Tagabacteria bacterium RIFCSPLOWO2_01_FULL_39_11 TaxID=1802295 RepID=A0A1G2LP70_9BACT|nr:MAG: 50S ribosomal protein L31 [Candidatus Tagabacteria bacterium RIFCSPLOWO2_01_FULL_39_11]
MKKEIHPKYYPNAKISCACGNIINVGSAKENMEVEICANCHPFYTGKEKIIDTAGRVEKFKLRQAKKKSEKKKVRIKKTEEGKKKK